MTEKAHPIVVFARSVYGNTLIYPHNAEAHMLAELVGAKTLQQRHLQLARELGHDIEWMADPRLPQPIR